MYQVFDIWIRVDFLVRTTNPAPKANQENRDAGDPPSAVRTYLQPTS
jgi:hypothetical protein